jgi:hypothetical protein
MESMLKKKFFLHTGIPEFNLEPWGQRQGLYNELHAFQNELYLEKWYSLAYLYIHGNLDTTYINVMQQIIWINKQKKVEVLFFNVIIKRQFYSE